ncbi:hypothetical protein [Alkalicoccobacillus porphyridii]|uniref:Uncharacterized protein n=1 Tax=Alkalicoccobacillus porphyridii TaxID=2597270 RepID=A0A553ZVY2_9BACI|nr:hypothetical protein [Alkalicoccobacillus porphyridii]TSB45638.1 hypothetical protein FN960_15840 [Alkalicoccobacillus porphyridii]
MKRKHVLIGGISGAILLVAYLFWPAESSPEARLDSYLHSINQTDFEADADRVLQYVDTTEVNEDFMDEFKNELGQRSFFDHYHIGEASYESDQEVTLPVTITWDEYWQHSFTFTLELKNLEWLIVPDFEMLAIVKSFDYQLDHFVQTNVNYVNTFEAPSNIGIQLEVPAVFEVYLLGVPDEVQYDAGNQSLTLPIVDEATRVSSAAPEAHVVFPDESEVYYEDYFSFPY